MQITLGFLVILLLIIFPGLLFRRLYFYGEFSKQFDANLNLIKLLAVSSVPGLVNLFLIFFLYNYLISPVDLGEIVDIFKDINNPTHRFDNPENFTLNEIFNKEVVPFLSFLYLTSIMLGLLTGRLIRITNIDKKFKLLRFKNNWFYMFSGDSLDFKKMKYMKERNTKHVFTKADILIDTNSNPILNSGIVVDYEINSSDCQRLERVMLKEAKRYKLQGDNRIEIPIPGNILIVDCTHLKNINLTYVREKYKPISVSILESKLPIISLNVHGIILILLLPFLIIKSSRIDFQLYNFYFDLHWFLKFLAIIFIFQLISFLNPFVKNKLTDKYEWAGFKQVYVPKLISMIIIAIILYFFG